jgi:hypothetical protein
MCITGFIIRIISGIAGDTVGKILRCQFEDKWGSRGLKIIGPGFLKKLVHKNEIKQKKGVLL